MNIEEKIFKSLNKSIKVYLKSQRYEFAFPDIKGELNKANQLFNKSIDENGQLAGKASEQLIKSTKPIIEIRASLYKNMEDFKIQYKNLIGQSADSTQQVKDFNIAIKQLDKQVEDLASLARKISQAVN